MELVNLATKQSFVFDFPIEWAEGGPISEDLYYFCGYHTNDHVCVTLNIETLEIEQTGVTVRQQIRSKAVTIEHEGQQVIWLAGGDTNGLSRSSQLTSLTENRINDDVGIELPVGIQAYCMVTLNSTTVAVLAGMNFVSRVNSKKMWYYHVQDNQWVEGPDLKVGRRWAGCGAFNYGDSTYILVVGGTGAGKSVEMLNIRGNAWFDGKIHIVFQNISSNNV